MLSYVVSGKPGGLPLLLIHPMGADKTFWDACRDVWDERAFSVSCDLRGAGTSPRPDGPLAFDRHTEDLEDLRRTLGLDHIVVVGCAVGSMIAARYAAAYSEYVAAAVLSNPAIRTRAHAKAMLAQRADDVRRGGIAAALPAAIDGAFAGCPDDERRASYIARFRTQDPQCYAATLESILDADVTHDLAQLHCPTLLVPGGMDRLLPPDHAQEIMAVQPHAELVLIESGAHFIPYQRPLEFAGHVLAFLERHALIPVAMPAGRSSVMP